MERKTMQQLIESEKNFFTAADVAGVVGCDPNNIRVVAHQRPELLGFPVTIMGSRVKIPKIPFLRYMGIEV